jgi:hypothetical protein
VSGLGRFAATECEVHTDPSNHRTFPCSYGSGYHPGGADAEGAWSGTHSVYSAGRCEGSAGFLGTAAPAPPASNYCP